jgi:hypothetical protein
MNNTDIVTITNQVNSSDNDVEEYGDGTGQMYSTSTDLELTTDGSKGNQVIGIKFANVSIPIKMEITEAYIEFTAESIASGAVTLNISADSSSSPDDFSTTAFDVSTRIKTNSTVNWSPASWTDETTYVTPELKTIVQELVSENLWAYGNDLTFIIEGNGDRSAFAYDGDPLKAPILTIKFKQANGSPILNSVTDQTTNINTSIDIIQSMINATDPENNNLTLVLQSGANYTLQGKTVIPNNNFTGDLYVPINLTDGVSGSNKLTMLITVTNITSIYEIKPFKYENGFIIFDASTSIDDLSIVGVSGQVVLNFNKPQSPFNLESQKLRKGIYIITARSAGNEYHQKVVFH